MTYNAPIKDMLFILKTLSNVEDHADFDTFEAVLEEASKLAKNVWEPINSVGDRQHSKLEGNSVKTPDGFKDAYKQFAEGGWGAISMGEEHSLPYVVDVAVNEMWQSSNLSLSLCTFITEAAVGAIYKHGSDKQKEIYIPKLSSGEWTGTMLLTESQAGSDLSAITTNAKKEDDVYLLKGQKIFSTWGDNDFTDNIAHLVLANIDGMIKGPRGMGLFIVPKFLVNDDATLGERNDIKVVSLETKMGLNASPTCTIAIGAESEGAVGYLVGEEGKGLLNMFTMMNTARVFVGLQGVAVSERAYQNALTYAKERDQAGVIIDYPDVRRMLLTMKANIEASRALVYYASSMADNQNLSRLDFLTPLIKAWCSDLAIENTSLAVQVHGGAGFIEDSKAPQYYRDARALSIYEGTNGIQATDFVFRKIAKDVGVEAKNFIDEIRYLTGKMPKELKSMAYHLSEATEELLKTTEWVIDNSVTAKDEVAAAAVPYLDMFGTVLGGYMLTKMAYEADKIEDNSDEFYKTKITTARFYMSAILPKIYGLSKSIMGGYSLTTQLDNKNF